MNRMLASSAIGVSLASAALAQTTLPVSVATNGVYGNAPSSSPQLTAGGRYAVFESEASNLVPGDLNGVSDIFQQDLGTGATMLISVPWPGTGLANGHSRAPSIGRIGSHYVAFESDASNLVLGDTNGVTDIFIRDLRDGTTRRISETSTGAQANAPSFRPRSSLDGEWIAFESEAALVPSDVNGLRDIYAFDPHFGVLVLVSVTDSGVQGNGPSFDASRPQGHTSHISFSSNATNLVLGDTNGFTDIFIKPIPGGELRRVNLGPSGAQANGTSALSELTYQLDVVFSSQANNLVPGDTNQDWDLFVSDAGTGSQRRFNLTPAGLQTTGLQVATPSVSANSSVVYASAAPDIVAGDTNNAVDVFRYDLQTSRIERISLASDGSQLNSDSTRPQYDGFNGNCAFESSATNAVPGGSPGAGQVFARESDRITPLSVPCSSYPNSTGVHGELDLVGSSFIGRNDITIVAMNLPRNALGMLLAAQQLGHPPAPLYGLCLGNNIGRFNGPGQIGSTGPSGSMSLTVDLNAIPQANGSYSAVAASTVYFQAWTRDVSPTGSPTYSFSDPAGVLLW